MKTIKIIQTGYEKEKKYLWKNRYGIQECITGIGIIQIIMKSGEIREYHGALAQKVYNYAYKNC